MTDNPVEEIAPFPTSSAPKTGALMVAILMVLVLLATFVFLGVFSPWFTAFCLLLGFLFYLVKTIPWGDIF
jgi:hypothetical protein